MDVIAKPQSDNQSDRCQTVEDLTESLVEVLFNQRVTGVTTAGSETTSQTDSAPVSDSSLRDVPVITRSVSVPSGSKCAYSPADTGLRLEYLRQHHVVEGLHNDPDYSGFIAQLSRPPSSHAKSSLSDKLLDAIDRKHKADFEKALPVIQDLARNTSFLEQAVNLIRKSDQVLRNSGDIDEPGLIFSAGMLDSLYSQLTDISKLLNGELCTESLSVIHYINMISSEPVFDLDILQLDQSHVDEKKPSPYHKKKVALKLNRTLYDLRAINMTGMIANYRETELVVYSSISKTSAKHLHDYLRTNHIDRLFFPMAGAGYFSKSMIDAGMPSTCFDIHPPEKTFTRVTKADVFVSIDKFAKVLALTGGTMDSSALVLDAPQPTFMVGKERWIDAGEFLPGVIKSWCDHGGKNLLVISEASDQELLFSSNALKRMNIVMIPVIPGFPPEIFKGLGEYVGICGLYRIDKK
ncbi:hypothetical protein [Endozoicomonas sp. SCSIO W0465]|uniref:hypothetical protein n=1 Tax=Endozoicomonas sp. SCSIO W0465 TaxID=2918516 RepID=UPI0020758629|nr:hypothetical protein [Endozoicomonas sp. SCSIO W0465]USE36526.1 hypothetical protein MJO57_31705 [Endozoicomonas sp. SCSIO W0465]